MMRVEHSVGAARDALVFLGFCMVPFLVMFWILKSRGVFEEDSFEREDGEWQGTG